MNKLYPAILFPIILFMFFKTTAQTKEVLPDVICKEKNSIYVCVYPQTEIISIIQTIGQYPDVLGFLMVEKLSDYKSEVINHFQPFKNHPVVQMFDRLSQQPRMLNFSAPSNIMLYLDRTLQLRKDIIPEDFVMNRIGGIDSLYVFLRLLDDFITKSSFNEFFLNHSDYYNKIIDHTLKNIGTTKYISELENFYGITQKSYNIVLVSLYGNVGFGNSLICADNKREIYNTMGSKDVNDNMPFFGDELYLKYLIRHEFSHPFVNPLTEKYRDYIKDNEYRYDSIPLRTRENVCGDWQECINEFIVRAVTTHLAYNESKESGLSSRNKEESSGVFNLEDILEKIRFIMQTRKNTLTLILFIYVCWKYSDKN